MDREGARRPAARDRAVVSSEDRKWWSFQPLAKVDPPPLEQNSRVMNPVDRFIMAKARAKGLQLAPRADPRTLLRRVHLDLTGLPPSPEEIDRFLSDRSVDAWPRVLERLLASPHYGERWARHWLDVARFAESSGFEHDYDREGAFHYRDFVIKALNMDLPFDQFVRWQIAGDEFDPDNALVLSATGFLGAGVFPTQITANEVERTRYDALDDMLATTGSAFLGLTIGCARCHDHKYDPIPNRDYYRLLSSFTTTVRSVIDLDLDPEKTRRQQEKWEAERLPLAQAISRQEKLLKPRFDLWLAGESTRDASTAIWSVLEPTDLISKAGAKFKALDDGSLLAEGKNGDDDDYTFTAPITLRRITALRLDALAHASLPKGGPGRADNGNIGLSRIWIFAVPSGGGATTEVKIATAQADFEQNQANLAISGALDDVRTTGWAIDPQVGKDHAAVFTFAKPLEFTNGGRLTVKLEFHLNTKHNLGRTRLAVTGAGQPTLQGEVMPPAIAGLLERARASGPLTQLTETNRTTIFNWWKRGDAGWRERTAVVDEHARKKPDGRTKVLVCAEGYPALRMHTQGADFFNESYFLKRGNSDLKDGVASQGFLQVLMPTAGTEKRWAWTPPAGAKYSGRRRSLANWLTDVDQGAGALLARVAVNRVWQHHFGQGIVATPSDFGRTGTAPTHPELLDWLARELVRSGWRLSHIHQLLLTSATYQQATTPDRAKEKIDPDNQLFVRRLPRRLEGEAVRDSLLAVSGALDPSLFGRGTKDENSRRRSIYFTIKRSQLIGSMVAFDQPEPLVSQGFRATTTVAPQALLLMNGPQVRAWAKAFAARLEKETKDANDPAALVHRGYLVALGRPPTPDEARDGSTFLNEQQRSYDAEGQKDSRVLALADFCQVLFGLNEFAYEN